MVVLTSRWCWSIHRKRRIVVFHSPKQYAFQRHLKEDIERRWTLDALTPVLFLHSYDPRFDGASGAYWFSRSVQTAMTHADHWRDGEGTKWRLTLKCSIPASSTSDFQGHYKNVLGEKVQIHEVLWWLHASVLVDPQTKTQSGRHRLQVVPIAA